MNKILISDLDRTILPTNGNISSNTLNCFKHLKNKGYIRVIATGRSMYSVYKVINEDFPVDYMIFSTGAGIIEWKSKRLIYNKKFPAAATSLIARTLIKENIDFMIFEPIPDNHKFRWHKGSRNNTDFYRRFKTYINHSSKINSCEDYNIESCQILAILPPESENFNYLSSLFPYASTIRATSPIDHQSIWLEIFPQEVSKGHSCLWLMDKLGIKQENSIGIGNDYNDIAFLDICNESFVVDNAPKELKNKYKTLPKDEEDGFSHIINKL